MWLFRLILNNHIANFSLFKLHYGLSWLILGPYVNTIIF